MREVQAVAELQDLTALEAEAGNTVDRFRNAVVDDVRAAVPIAAAVAAAFVHRNTRLRKRGGMQPAAGRRCGLLAAARARTEHACNGDEKHRPKRTGGRRKAHADAPFEQRRPVRSGYRGPGRWSMRPTSPGQPAKRAPTRSKRSSPRAEHACGNIGRRDGRGTRDRARDGAAARRRGSESVLALDLNPATSATLASESPGIERRSSTRPIPPRSRQRSIRCRRSTC